MGLKKNMSYFHLERVITQLKISTQTNRLLILLKKKKKKKKSFMDLIFTNLSSQFEC